MDKKIIMITGSTDGIGLETAKALAALGHGVILHGRNGEKLAAAQKGVGKVEGAYQADFSKLDEVAQMADQIAKDFGSIDVLINNTGILRTSAPITDEGQDVRFVVNTIAPYLLTKKLLPILADDGRVVNLSSAAQAPVDLRALKGEQHINDALSAYAQSKLALTMWNEALAKTLGEGQVMVSVNPGSLLGTKMVKEGFGTSGNDVQIGVDILTRAGLAEEFAIANGRYYDNDNQRFAKPHTAGQDASAQAELVGVLDEMIEGY